MFFSDIEMSCNVTYIIHIHQKFITLKLPVPVLKNMFYRISDHLLQKSITNLEHSLSPPSERCNEAS